MLTNALTWLALLLVAVLLFWLAKRALRLRNPGARWGLALVAVIPAVAFTAAVGLIGFGYVKMYMPRSVAALTLETTSTPERIARGAHLARTTCVACHSTNGELPLSGGIDLSAHSPLPIGTIVPPNLTPGGPLKSWSDIEIAQAIRNGQHKSGRALFVMPTSLRNLSDEDVASLVAFLRSQPAIQNETPDLAASPLIAAFVGIGMVDIGAPPVEGKIAAPPKQPHATYGEYVLSYQDCQSCHGEDLNGVPEGLGPATPSIHGAIRGWTAEQFIQTMRTGIDPGGHPIQDPMPWQMLGEMDDTELTALYHYLRGGER